MNETSTHRASLKAAALAGVTVGMPRLGWGRERERFYRGRG